MEATQNDQVFPTLTSLQRLGANANDNREVAAGCATLLVAS